jgi:Rrf2 family protein
MQLTRAADYAVRVMIHLAGLPPGARASRGELARAAECPEQFLSKVLQSLTRAGLVISHRGNTGGFELLEAHRGASLLDVVQAIEGPVRLNLCLTSDHACGRQQSCPAHGVWAEAQKAMLGVLESASIGQLAKRVTGRNGNGGGADAS